LRRVELDRHDELARREETLQLGLLVAATRRRGLDADVAADAGRRRPPVLDDGLLDRRDLGRRRAAAAADQPRAELPGVGGELREVRRRRVRIDNAAAG